LSKAIVAPDQPNHREILVQGVDAVLYDPQDPRGIESALDSLSRDGELCKRVATAAGQVIARKQLTWRQHAEKVASLFSGLAQQDGSRAGQSGSLGRGRGR
jgi:glycosyltransferase involved in cell wall biosynthesis